MQAHESDKFINAELIGSLLKLNNFQQEKVLSFINEILSSNEMTQRAQDSLRNIEEGEIFTAEQFTAEFEEWKAKKRA